VLRLFHTGSLLVILFHRERSAGLWLLMLTELVCLVLCKSVLFLSEKTIWFLSVVLLLVALHTCKPIPVKQQKVPATSNAYLTTDLMIDVRPTRVLYLRAIFKGFLEQATTTTNATTTTTFYPIVNDLCAINDRTMKKKVLMYERQERDGGYATTSCPLS